MSTSISCCQASPGAFYARSAWPFAASGYIDANRLAPLVDESLQRSRIMGASVATARRRLREEGEDLE